MSEQRLPYCIRVLLESAKRNVDKPGFGPEAVERILNWSPKGNQSVDIPFMPARVVLQDFTGVPAIVDLAALRDAVKRLGGDVSKVNPFIPCDLVIDHSVQVDFFGSSDALSKNEALEFERNQERYRFLKWGQAAFKNMRVVPPSTGIVHQVNLEFLSQVVFVDADTGVAYPDSCVGTDSHTPMVNGLGVLAWGVGGIEAEAVMLGQAITMQLPEVIGVRVYGRLPEGATATDLVLRVTELCRKKGVVGKFVEFIGEGVSSMSIADRATISNMAPEQGSTVSFFPVDEQTLRYLRLSGRDESHISIVESYCRDNGFFREDSCPEPEYTDYIELNLETIVPALAGPKRPHDRVSLLELPARFPEMLTAEVGPQGFGLEASESAKTARLSGRFEGEEISQGSVLIAAITSCTNTSNPAVMVAAGLLAKNAVERGLSVKPFVKTSLAPGSTVVTEYLEKADLLEPLSKLGFHLVGYGCTTCIGNSGPMPEEVERAISESDLVVSAVLSGNRNFEGRVHPHTRANFLASPPLVVAYALAGSLKLDLLNEPIGVGSDGKPVMLKEIWPSSAEIEQVVAKNVTAELFTERYASVFEGSERWQQITVSAGEQFEWDESSTYVQAPPFFTHVTKEAGKIESVENARVIALFGDSVTTDHISPAGVIAKQSPAADYLRLCGVERRDFNSYGSRRGNHEVMMRGTFANIRLVNKLVPDSVGNVTKHFPTKDELSFFEAAERYRSEGVPLVIFAGKEYGSGSSRDWAAKGPKLLGVKAVIAESYERIHRSNLVGMGILPLELLGGTKVMKLGLTGEEFISIKLDSSLAPLQELSVCVRGADGAERELSTRVRIDTPVELDYYRDGGILCTVLKGLV